MPPERITVDTVSQLARATGRAQYVADPARVSWAKSVATLFLGGGEVPTTNSPIMASMLPDAGGGAGKVAIVFALITAGAIAVFGRRGR
jgi:hypothetical protein